MEMAEEKINGKEDESINRFFLNLKKREIIAK